VEISRSAGIGVGDLPANIKRTVEETRFETEQTENNASQDSQSGVN
jgi:hypothetical protein